MVSVESSIEHFVSEARQYCDLVERSEAAKSSWTFANECLQSILRLYSSALALPEGEADNDHSADDRLGHPEWEKIRARVADKLSRDVYWEVFDPMVMQPPEPLVGSISDDLADIWRDVQVGLQIFNGNADAAAWHWRFSMETHWGRHAAGAAAALTALCYGPNADATRP